jgi:LCP family protein required for cell wall assembly
VSGVVGGDPTPGRPTGPLEEPDGLARLGLEPAPTRGERLRAERRRRRRPVILTTVAALAVLIGVPIAAALVGVGYLVHLASAFDDRTTTIAGALPDYPGRPGADVDGALNILLLGSDARAQGDAGRSDVLMLVHLPADRSSIEVLSIMRDSWVEIPGHGEAKINAAYSWGGVPLTVQTVERLLEVRIDHVAEIDFAGFEGMTDALGGVDVVSERAFTAGGHEFRPGLNHLDGDAALAFVRERSSFADADHQRVRNQQAFLEGLAHGVISRGTVTDPGRVSSFVGATAEHLAVDDSLTPPRLAEIGWSARGLTPGSLHAVTLPTGGGGVSADGQSYLVVDPDGLDGITAALHADEALPDGR